MGGTAENNNDEFKKFAEEMGLSDPSSSAGPGPEQTYSRHRPSFADFENPGHDRYSSLNSSLG